MAQTSRPAASGSRTGRSWSDRSPQVTRGPSIPTPLSGRLQVKSGASPGPRAALCSRTLGTGIEAAVVPSRGPRIPDAARGPAAIQLRDPLPPPQHQRPHGRRRLPGLPAARRTMRAASRRHTRQRVVQDLDARGRVPAAAVGGPLCPDELRVRRRVFERPGQHPRSRGRSIATRANREVGLEGAAAPQDQAARRPDQDVGSNLVVLHLRAMTLLVLDLEDCSVRTSLLQCLGTGSSRQRYSLDFTFQPVCGWQSLRSSAVSGSEGASTATGGCSAFRPRANIRASASSSPRASSILSGIDSEDLDPSGTRLPHRVAGFP